jgi:multidrug efflux pump subunit AcrA (membrane-fusion protein)
LINAAAENDWIVRVGLPDVDWVRIKKGDRAIVKTDAYPGEELAAEVSLISEGTDPMSGLYPVEIKVNPKNVKLASGMIARVEIIPATTQQLKSVPIEAIVEGSGSDAFVFVVAEDGRSVRKLPVKISYLTATDAMVVSGLEGVKEVVTGGSAFLTQFSTVKVATN